MNFDFLPEQYVQEAEHQSLTTMIFFGLEEILLKIEIYYKVVSCKLKPYRKPNKWYLKKSMQQASMYKLIY